MAATEHILLESDAREVPHLRTARRVHSEWRARSRLRRRAAELTLIDVFYLSVRTWRSRLLDLQYVLDLRFVDPNIEFSRHIAWRCIAATAVLFLLTGVTASAIAASATPWLHHGWLPACVTLFGLSGCAALASLYRTTETLTLYSAHGRARVLVFIGGPGTFRAGRQFAKHLAAHLRVAVRRRSRAQHLRDEMRELFRLKGFGAISEQEYEVGKRLILEAHPPRRDVKTSAAPSPAARVAQRPKRVAAR
jgi:hypothetical protein